jgi:hypothetical protein
LFVPPENGFEPFPGVIALFVENRFTVVVLEEMLGEVVPNMLVFSEEGFAGLPKGLGVEKIGFTLEVVPNTLGCCVPLVIWDAPNGLICGVPLVICEPPNGLLCGVLTDGVLLNGFQPVPFVEVPKGEVPAVLGAGANGLNGF